MQTKAILKDRCDQMLLALLGSQELVGGWWHRPNKAFNGLTPEGQWVIEFNSVYSYLLSHCSGDYY